MLAWFVDGEKVMLEAIISVQDFGPAINHLGPCDPGFQPSLIGAEPMKLALIGETAQIPVAQQAEQRPLKSKVLSSSLSRNTKRDSKRAQSYWGSTPSGKQYGGSLLKINGGFLLQSHNRPCNGLLIRADVGSSPTWSTMAR